MSRAKSVTYVLGNLAGLAYNVPRVCDTAPRLTEPRGRVAEWCAAAPRSPRRPFRAPMHITYGSYVTRPRGRRGRCGGAAHRGAAEPEPPRRGGDAHTSCYTKCQSGSTVTRQYRYRSNLRSSIRTIRTEPVSTQRKRPKSCIRARSPARSCIRVTRAVNDSDCIQKGLIYQNHVAVLRGPHLHPICQRHSRAQFVTFR